MADPQETFRKRLAVFNIRNDNRESIKNYPGARVDDETQSKAMHWCDTILGLNWIWTSPFQTDYTDFFFLTKEDALMFVLQFGARYLEPKPTQ